MKYESVRNLAAMGRPHGRIPCGGPMPAILQQGPQPSCLTSSYEYIHIYIYIYTNPSMQERIPVK